jgi:hypothetical protein
MDEQRQQDYLNLIANTLLSCASSEEAQILNANPELIDAEFMEAIDHLYIKVAA